MFLFSRNQSSTQPTVYEGMASEGDINQYHQLEDRVLTPQDRKKKEKKAVNGLRNVSEFKTHAGIDLISLPGCLL